MLLKSPKKIARFEENDTVITVENSILKEDDETRNDEEVEVVPSQNLNADRITAE